MANVILSAGNRLTIFVKKVAGNVIPPGCVMTSCALVSDCGIVVSIEISALDPVRISSSSFKTNLIFVKIGIVVRDEIARDTSFKALINACRLIVNCINRLLFT